MSHIAYGGQGSRPDSKGCDLPTLVEIMMLSPARKGAAVRRLAAVTLCRVLGGEKFPELADRLSGSSRNSPSWGQDWPLGSFVTLLRSEQTESAGRQ